MASNAPGQSTQSAYSLGPRVSLDGGAPLFTVGECVLIRIPEEIQVEGYVEDEASANGTRLPPISRNNGPQHFAFITEMRRLRGNRSVVLEVCPILAFSNSGGALATYNNLSDAAKSTLLPLPPLSPRHPTPEVFGEPISLGNRTFWKDSFVHLVPRWITMPMNTTFKRMDPPLILPLEVLIRIDDYRTYLSTTNTNTNEDRSHPPPNGGSGDEGGTSNSPHGQTGDGGGQAASGVMSVTSSPTLIDGGGGGGAAEEGLAKYALLTLEDVDEDAADADATTREDLIMLASYNPIWKEELRRYLQEEKKEKESIQNERAARLARWREDMAV